MLIIVVTVTLVRCTAQQNPVDDTRMYQFVRQDQRLFIRQGGKYSGIGMVTAVEQQGGFASEAVGHQFFQLGIDHEIPSQ